MKRTSAGIIGAVFVLTVIVLQHLFMGRAVVMLSVGFSIAFAVWLATYDAHPHLRRGRVLLVYGIAVVVSGAYSFRCRGVEHVMTPGSVMTINPGELHDGRAVDSRGSNEYELRSMLVTTDAMATFADGFIRPNR